MKILFVIYDNDAFLHWFPIGPAYLSAVLKNAGHQVDIYQQDVYHYPEEHLTRHLDSNRYDVVGVGIIAGYYQYRKLLKISSAINKSKNRPVYVIGGHGPSPEPLYFLEKTGADAVVIGEGEETMPEFVKVVFDRKQWKEIRGIAYLDDSGNLVRTKERPLIHDLDSLPFPAWDLFHMDYYSLYRFPNIKQNQRGFPVISGRGCAFTCNFCYRMDKGLRQRRVINVIDEIKYLKDRYNITYIEFADELLMSSESRTVEFCEAILGADLGINWCCNGRLNYAAEKVLGLMKRAGCVFINYGIESMDDAVLANMDKKLTTDQIIRGVENTIRAGISPGLNIIFGNIGDRLETLRKGVEFLIKYDDASQLRTIRPVTPYPGSPLYYHAIERGLMKDCADFYENKHVNSDLLSVNFTEMSDRELHEGLLSANEKLVTNHFLNRKDAVMSRAKKLYLDLDSGFRGFRH